MSEQTQHLLERSELESEHDEYDEKAGPKKTQTSVFPLEGLRAHPLKHMYFTVLHVALLISLLALALDHDKITSPVSVRYVQTRKMVNEYTENQFAGRPTKEKDKAWEALIEPTYVGMTAQQLRAVGEEPEDSIKLKDKEEYVAALEVYHQVHCLRWMRFFLYSDRYFSNATKGEMRALKIHMDHCIDSIRASLMCQADTSLLTFRWETKNNKVHPVAKSNAIRKCARWSDVEQWAMERRVPLDPNVERPAPFVDEESLER